jgi:CheY-like chemotaxis protein
MSTEHETGICLNPRVQGLEPSGVTGKRILIADDQPEVRETMRLLLGLDDHTVVEASNGVEALALFVRGQFDLVITDYAMPEMKGDELALGIKRLDPMQPVLMVSGSAFDLPPNQNPADALLNKPFTLTALRESVAELLEPGAVRCPQGR